MFSNTTQFSTSTAKIARIIASGFGSGYAPFASGTVGSLACLALWAAIDSYHPLSHLEFFIGLIAITVLGLASTAIAIKGIAPSASSRGYSKVDPSFVVIDEWAGMWICLFGLHAHQYVEAFLAFFLFRAFDVLKPGPIRSLEKKPGAWGIMLDDLAAGLLALVFRVVVSYPLGY